MSARRVEPMSQATSDLIAAAHAVPDVVVAVQEAVYNAIDGNATSVRVIVDIARGSFSVVDDGAALPNARCKQALTFQMLGDGIHPDEIAEHLFECRASSKANPNQNRSTYGKQGRFLLALGTLAKEVSLKSRVNSQWTSFQKIVKERRVVFNARSKTTETSKGTTLTVENLFWKLPVRQSGLASDERQCRRQARRLSTFFRSISMIWPTLSIDASFTNSNIPRCTIRGVVTCQDRLRDVFGELLGGDLEYIKYDVDDSPFIVRGYIAIIKDGGGRGTYIESSGWRQARAYYQFVYLDNLWLEDIQRDCCKVINNAVIALSLGIPIFVLKIATKGEEYEVLSDGSSRVVNLKNPEMLRRSLVRFIQMLTEKGKCKNPSNPSNFPNSPKNISPDVFDDRHSSIEELREEWVGDNNYGFDDVWYLEDESIEFSMGSTCKNFSAPNQERLHMSGEELFYTSNVPFDCITTTPDGESWSYSDSQNRIVHTSDSRWDPQCNTVYVDEHISSASQAIEYIGCEQCGYSYSESTRGRKSFSREDINSHPYDSYQYSQVTEYNLNQFNDRVAEPEASDMMVVQSQSQVAYFRSSWSRELDATTGTYSRRNGIDRVIQAAKDAELDQLFFGNNTFVQSSPAIAHTRGRDLKRSEVQPQEGWVSSRRLGACKALSQSLSFNNCEKGDTSQHSFENNVGCTIPDDNTPRVASSESARLSDYFSLDKLTSNYSKLSSSIMSKFASKRASLAESTDRLASVDAKKVPRSITLNETTALTLDKSMIQRLQVIRQVDRKFILVKLMEESLANDEISDKEVLLMCIDQHAADERVRLEHLEARVFGVSGDERNIEVAVHDPPLSVLLNDCEREIVHFFDEELRSWGFSGEFGPIIANLKTTPKIETRVAGVDDFREYLHLLRDSNACIGPRVLRPPVITRFLHSRACRSAIMFGDYLSLSQCEDIIDQLQFCNLPFQCAHGRPSIVPLVELK